MTEERIKLKEIGKDERHRYIATVGRVGVKRNSYKGYGERTILLKDIKLLGSDDVITDHLWLTCGVTLKKLDLKAGDSIEFNARVASYYKGYYKDDIDYKLERPTKYTVIRALRELEENEKTTASPVTQEELSLYDKARWEKLPKEEKQRRLERQLEEEMWEEEEEMFMEMFK